MEFGAWENPHNHEERINAETWTRCYISKVFLIDGHDYYTKSPSEEASSASRRSSIKIFISKREPGTTKATYCAASQKDAGVCSNTLDAIAFRLHFHKPLESERRSPVDVGVDGRGHRKCRISRRKNRIVPRCCISVGIVWISSAERKNRSSTNECPKNVKRVRYAGCWA